MSLLPPVFTQSKRDRRELPTAEIVIQSPGHKREKTETSPLSFLLPAGFTVVGLVVMIVASSSAGGSETGGSPMLLAAAVSVPMMIGSYIVAYINYRNNKKKYERDVMERESRYRERLRQVQDEVVRLHAETQRAMEHNAPGPEACLALVDKLDQSRMWVRQSYEEDFLDVRLGLGDMPSRVRLEPPSHSTATDVDPLIDEAQGLAKALGTVRRVPVSLPLKHAGIAGICGEREAQLSCLRALVLQIATHHSPDDVKIVALYPARDAAEWSWLRWLPHTWSEERDMRYLACRKQQAHELLADLGQRFQQRKATLGQRATGLVVEAPRPAYVILLADPSLLEGEPITRLLLREASDLCAYSVFLVQHRAQLPPQCQAWVELQPSGGVVAPAVPGLPERLEYEPDVVSTAFVDRFARRLAPVRCRSAQKEVSLPNVVTLYEVLGIQQVEDLDLMRNWQAHDPNVSMAVPVGRRASGDLQYWDLQEPLGKEPTIDKWQGPNALVAGTVGSGKSELLRALLLSLAVRMHPHRVCFVLLDFKPPGLVDDAIVRLPHTLNAITDLQIELVPRALASLENELRRREHMLDEASRVTGRPVRSLQEYQALYERGVVKEPLPYLVLVVDEFTRLKQDLPEALDHFVKIAIVGRSFGFRMILATQKPIGVVTGQIEANTPYRAALRVAKVEDSREVVGDDEAAHFTRAGRVHWRLGQGAALTYQSAWPGAPVPQTTEDDGLVDERIFTLALGGTRTLISSAAGASNAHKGRSQYEALIEYVGRVAERETISQLRKVWLEPLPAHLPQSAVPQSGGWNGQAWDEKLHTEWLSPVIGMLDDPRRQTQPPLVVDLGAHGHLYVCSGTGASTRMALRSLVERIAREFPPDTVHFYLLDFGNAGLQLFESLPHTGAVIRANETRRLHRLMRWLGTELDRRRQWLDAQGIATLVDYRASGSARSRLPALVLVIDGLGTIKDDTDEITNALLELTSRGREVGIHLVIAGDPNAQAGPMYKVLNNVRSMRLALQLDGPQAYREVVDAVPDTVVFAKGISGRGLYRGDKLLECQIMQPSDDNALLATAQAMRAAARQLGYQEPHPIRELPDLVDLGDLLPDSIPGSWAVHAADDRIRIPIGLDDAAMEVLWVDIEQDGPHFLITGPLGGGKSTTLYTWALALAELYPKELVNFVLLDTVSGSLAKLKELPHVTHYGASLSEHQVILQYLKQTLDVRETEGRQSPRPQIVVFIDDYQFHKMASDAVLTAMTAHAARGVLWGVHIVLVGESGQVSAWDPLPKQVLAGNSGLFVGSNDVSRDADVFGLTFTGAEAKQRFPQGRGYFVRHRTPQLIQAATPGDEATVLKRVRRVIEAHRDKEGGGATTN